MDSKFKYTRDQVQALTRNYRDNTRVNAKHGISRALLALLPKLENPSAGEMASWAEMAEYVREIQANPAADVFLPLDVIGWIKEALRE